MKLRIALIVSVIACIVLTSLYIDRTHKHRASRQQAADLLKENSALTNASRNYMNLYGTYAGIERQRQYGFISDNVRLFFGAAKDFTPIERITEHLVCPKPVKALPNGFTFFGMRNIVLNRKGASPLRYSASYQGNHAHIRDKDEFDSLIDLGKVDQGEDKIIHMTEAQAANLMRGAPRKMTRNGSYVTPFSFNNGDVNKDGVDDFFYGGRLHLSGDGTYKPIADAALDEREVIFFEDGFLAINGDRIESWALRDGKLALLDDTRMPTRAATNRPFTVMPLDGAVSPSVNLMIITGSTYDFYFMRNGQASRILSVPTTASHSVILGARGDFDDDGLDDLWMTESRWRNKEGEMVGRAMLLSSRKFNSAATRIEDLVSVTLIGSEAYTDYDGIGTTLSPVAGDFDGDGKRDLSVSGHINMNEAGALYILRGKDMTRREISVADPAVVRIVGRPASNLAPPFVHYDLPADGRSKIVVAADNDLCSGVAGGAIYFIDPSPLMRSSEFPETKHG